MPQDPKKQQKAVMKKRKKLAGQHKVSPKANLTFSKNAIIHDARSYPLLECWISSDWKNEQPGLVQIIIARQQPDGRVCCGLYLVDKLCLGLKNTFVRTDYSQQRYQREVFEPVDMRTPLIACDLELAQQMIYASIDYAAQFGFTPQRDFNQSQYLLTPRGELPEPYKITFGRKGKPLYIAGPDDNSRFIIQQLEQTAGPGNFNFMSPLADF
ncbi:hypothetical protein [Dictyobacter kobayashii]|uniref:Uncharacterized protein n=1 Tax=Dictyobacter kobayashii TaxID=2014872 RepID=A0A402ABG4_9CHLR|nr:hypothetical protein [Dictyobacter kobayashii]GCE16434.1 hypothetical protein KDK_02340 [Dictyobacter kobayashii]